jgi:mannose-6-phosphate isomerase-like protein (cupin superfamily)
LVTRLRGDKLDSPPVPLARFWMDPVPYNHVLEVEVLVLKIIDLNAAAAVPMENGRGETIRLVNTTLGTDKIDVHLNRLVPGGPPGRLHRHSQSDNVYIVRCGEGCLNAGGEEYTIRTNHVVFIPAGMPHSLSNLSSDVFEILEIYAPAGRQFDFTPVE